MKECTQCEGYMSDKMFYTIGPTRRMSECKQCNKRRKSDWFAAKMAEARVNQRELGR